MTRRKQSNRIGKQRRREVQRRQNQTIFNAVLSWLIPEGELFTEDRFHGNIKWSPEQLAQLSIVQFHLVEGAVGSQSLAVARDHRYTVGQRAQHGGELSLQAFDVALQRGVALLQADRRALEAAEGIAQGASLVDRAAHDAAPSQRSSWAVTQGELAMRAASE